jgi:hypothetical protein
MTTPATQVVYQIINGARRPIAAGYIVTRATASEPHVRLRLARYDRSRTLVVDPLVQFRLLVLGARTSNTNDAEVSPRIRCSRRLYNKELCFRLLSFIGFSRTVPFGHVTRNHFPVTSAWLGLTSSFATDFRQFQLRQLINPLARARQ